MAGLPLCGCSDDLPGRGFAAMGGDEYIAEVLCPWVFAKQGRNGLCYKPASCEDCLFTSEDVGNHLNL